MSKTYQIKSLDAKGQAQVETILPAQGGAPTVIKALAGSRYSLIDVQQNSAPDNIRVQRSGKHLRIMFDGSRQPDLVLENFFDGSSTEFKSSLAGATDSGALHEYVPETGNAQHALAQLEDNGSIVGMALGSMEVPVSTGAAVGLLAPLAGGGLGIGAAGAAALGAAALGGGGGGGGPGPGPAKPVVTSLTMASSSDSGPLGDNITNVQRPTIVGKASANSEVTVTLNNKSYTTNADANGDFSITVPGTEPALNAGRYSMQAVAKKSGVASDPFNGTPFTVDLSGNDNIDSSGKTSTDPNTSAILSIESMMDDTGPNSDFITSDNTLAFGGKAAGYTNNGDKLKVTLERLNESSATLLFTEYLSPDDQNQWNWSLADSKLDMGKYTLKAILVDGAGNAVSSPKSQDIVIDNDAGKNLDGNGKVISDANTDAAHVLISNLSYDTGLSNNDFKTNDNTLIFKGTLEQFTVNGDLVMVQLKNSTGAITHSAYITPSGNAWTWDLSSQVLPSGQYTLQASIVDPAGTQVRGTNVQSQTLWVDTSFSQNIDNGKLVMDPNAGLEVRIDNMTDTGGSNNDRITKEPQPVFSGNFGNGKNWTDNEDRLKFQIFDLQGHLLPGSASAAVSSDKASWSTGSWSSPLSEGTYIAKAFITDTAGNVLSVDQKAFAVDRTAPSLEFSQSIQDIRLVGNAFDNGLTVTYFSLSSNEAVHYTIKSGNSVLAEGNYSGSATTSTSTINGSFNAGEFTVIYTDAAGNTSSYTHGSKLVFNNVAVTTSTPTHGYSALPAPLDKLDAVGTIQLTTADQALDLTSIIGNSEFHNHVDMSASGSQHLSLNLNDVLNLGVVNSFRLDNLIQMRVDGSSSDTLVFKDRSAWEVSSSTVDIGANHYNLYTSYDATHHLVEVMVQQGIQVS